MVERVDRVPTVPVEKKRHSRARRPLLLNRNPKQSALEANHRIAGRVETMPREFSVIIERDPEGYYVATVPELPGCHTQAKSLDTLMRRVREAIELCLEVEGGSIPCPEFIGVQRIRVER
jgi:predicted RNase H-like HicB family nuclease